MSAPDHAAKLKAASKAQIVLERTAANSVAAAEKRDAALFAAQKAGASYRELADATGLSEARVTQVLRRERERTESLT